MVVPLIERLLVCMLAGPTMLPRPHTASWKPTFPALNLQASAL